MLLRRLQLSTVAAGCGRAVGATSCSRPVWPGARPSYRTHSTRSCTRGDFSRACPASTVPMSMVTSWSPLPPPSPARTASTQCAPDLGGRGTASSAGMLRLTRVNLFLPPQVARLLGGAALVLAQTFFVAYRRESRKLEEEESENERDSGQRGARADKPFMTPVEAIQLLGVEKVNPGVLLQARNISDGSQKVSDVLPLRNAKDREVAKQNFERMFAIAMKHENLFIAGKLSCAYRICVDGEWDQAPDDATAPSSHDATSRLDDDSSTERQPRK